MPLVTESLSSSGAVPKHRILRVRRQSDNGSAISAGNDPEMTSRFAAALAKAKTYDITDVDGTAAELRKDIASFRSILEIGSLEDQREGLEGEKVCKSFIRIIRALERDVDFSTDLEYLRGVDAKFEQWLHKSGESGNTSWSPFVTNIHDNCKTLIQCIDQLHQQHGNDLAEIGIHFPIIVAVGSESAGKSSVMEMIAGQPLFPRDEGTCTRLPLRLQFRHLGPAEKAEATFQGCSHEKLVSAADMQREIARITKERTNNRDVSTTELVLTLKMENVPDLTLVDLPGLIGSTYASEKAGLKEKVCKLATSYIQQPHAIVLAVAPATQRPRDCEVFNMIKQHGAENRTIGLLTKCDLAAEKRHRLEDKLGPNLSQASQEEQEKYGYIPLERGYFGMICRDTENHDRLKEAEQTQEAIMEARAREKTAFDELIKDPIARSRCGTDNVHAALGHLILDYIEKEWRPDTIKKVGQEILKTRSEIQDLHFSERYQEPPHAKDWSTEKYKQEVHDRVWKMQEVFAELMRSSHVSDRLIAIVKKVDSVELSQDIFGNGTLASMLKHVESALYAAFEDIRTDLVFVFTCLLEETPCSRHLPHLRSCAQACIQGRVVALVNDQKAQLQNFIIANATVPLPLRVACREEVCKEIQNVVLRMSNDDACSICHSTMLSSKANSLQVDLVRCCNKHFHRECLQKALTAQARVGQTVSPCPLCRNPLALVPQQSPSHKFPRKAELGDAKEAKTRLIQHAERAVAAIMNHLRLMTLGKDLEKLVDTPEHAQHGLLSETPVMQQRRRQLRVRLQALEHVESVVNAWTV